MTKTVSLEALKVNLLTIEEDDMVYDRETKELKTIKVHPDVFIVDNALIVGNDRGTQFCDPYGEFRGGYQWIHPKLVAWAKANDGYWEWRDGGAIMFIRN